jgi:hypothetical protein
MKLREKIGFKRAAAAAAYKLAVIMHAMLRSDELCNGTTAAADIPVVRWADQQSWKLPFAEEDDWPEGRGLGLSRHSQVGVERAAVSRTPDALKESEQ